jgi:hypothetical protein
VRVEERSTPDPGGKTVDVFPPTTHVSAIVLEPAVGFTEEALSDAVLGVLRDLRGSRNRRLRERDFPVYVGAFRTSWGEDLAAIGLPELFESRIHIAFQERVRSIADIRDIGRSAVADVEAMPFARYVGGHIILYGDPFVPPRARAGDLELRSYEVASTTTVPARRVPPPQTEIRAGLIHTIESWQKLGPAIVDFVGEMFGAASYRSLRLTVQNHFGIGVIEERDPAFPRYGSINTGWFTDDGGVRVDIRLRAALPPELKYVTLAHELSHYLLHFPLLYCGQLVEELSWYAPPLETWFGEIVSEHIGEGLSDLERDANTFTSYFLIPPRYDTAQMASLIFEGDRPPTPEELAWRFLQPLFPDRTAAQYSWRNLDEMRDAVTTETALASINAAEPDTLYFTALQALLRRETPDAADLREAVQSRVKLVYDRVFAELEDATDRDGTIDPAVLLNRISGRRKEPVIGTELGASRQLLAPRSGKATQDTRRLPLAPRSSRDRAMVSGRWLRVDAADQPRPVAAWQDAFSDRVIALYPYGRPPETDG